MPPRIVPHVANQAIVRSANMQPLDPVYLVDFLSANIDNKGLSADEFREMVRNTLPLYNGSGRTIKDQDEFNESTG